MSLIFSRYNFRKFKTSRDVKSSGYIKKNLLGLTYIADICRVDMVGILRWAYY